VDSTASAWKTFTTAANFFPTPGGALGGGYYAGQYLDPAGTGTLYNLIVAPVGPVTQGANTLYGQYGGATPAGIQWKTSATTGDTLGASSSYGAPAMIAYGNSTTYPMFNWCKSGTTGPNAGTYDATNATGTGIGGYNDWYIPSRNELYNLYFYLKPGTGGNDSSSGGNPNSVTPFNPNTNYGPNYPNQVTNPLFQTGGGQAFTTSPWYWSATEYTGVVVSWIIEFGSGVTYIPSGTGFKDSYYWARAMRRIPA
jgi:hypothetical protein